MASDQTWGCRQAFSIRMQVPQSCGFLWHSLLQRDHCDPGAVNTACKLFKQPLKTTLECLITIDSHTHSTLWLFLSQAMIILWFGTHTHKLHFLFQIYRKGGFFCCCCLLQMVILSVLIRITLP